MFVKTKTTWNCPAILNEVASPIFQFTEDQFTLELEQAIRESKIDFQVKKTLDDSVEKQKRQQQLQLAAKKPVTVSLNQFNSMDGVQVLQSQATHLNAATASTINYEVVAALTGHD